ncbi:hypothetical protein RYA99_17625 [Pseudomonas syringae pv. actinidifoliorum]|uniref:Uncharacterized protein n=2 Tax=Pseudomonas syringae group genomosp. 3 TaxID=251701 RepID=A0A3M4RXI3_9PSED|nr:MULTISPECIES: hypothetical protein [Pseudomonas syringae group]KPZ11826.1 Uncharacterized protein ALO40_01062 [Pseudomonas syringae pv. viburni]MDU8430505.1 hypothetical protein [Pseudomonas syringae pv. actinidifoliorum]MDU8521245.1 hypothetical protein [Pseudomonas syringae pv. actinidifoliorum]MDU8528000.1 hypothetical protein [Pseudomonas syringae pv. actinidifoliorum]NAS96396.1 hypothetical protein [Pseudomonas syringae pv. actinidifoliorum]
MDTHVARVSSSLVRLATLLLIIVCMGLIFAPERSQAQVANLATCLTGTHTANWSPGLTNTDQLVNVSTTSNWGPCVSPSFPLAVSASSSQNFQANFSCQSLLLQTPTITWVINWSDGATSTYEFSATLNNIGNLNTTIVGVGKIVDGRYKNAKAMSTFVLGDIESTLSNDCAKTTGVTSVSGLSTLVIAQ